ncbi:hypothetical protein SAMN06296241_0455 [Salinimicrobium sediminis]|uniref:Uncharacterized protein n=1 Tax=Salinimicrobium sediminis TaxID=1343891 RepID=A0A285X0T7_9FLAO|nr:hypothetical protein [Salinimicrobium sediminis]SOC78935.1 hypothetical protein SAMN06296241_0455 [Salinimicrobium sediminis]
MKESILLTCALIFFSIKPSSAQKYIPADLIPKGYVLFEEYSGDLNNDDRKDYVLIIKNTKEEKIVKNRFGDVIDRNRRGVIIILTKDNEYEKVVENKDCFSSENEDGGVYMPPELWINIEDNKLKIHYGHGRYGYWEYIFKNLDSEFKLIGYESSESNGPKVLYQTKIDFLKKEKTLSENTTKDPAVEEEIFEVISYDIKIDDLLRLTEIENFEDLDMTKY